jgi:hypothetical protein
MCVIEKLPLWDRIACPSVRGDCGAGQETLKVADGQGGRTKT